MNFIPENTSMSENPKALYYPRGNPDKRDDDKKGEKKPSKKTQILQKDLSPKK